MTDLQVKSLIDYLFNKYPYSYLQTIIVLREMSIWYQEYDSTKYASKDILDFFDKLFKLSQDSTVVYGKTFYVILRLVWAYFRDTIGKNRNEFFKLITLLQITTTIDNLEDKVNYFIRAVIPLIHIDIIYILNNVPTSKVTQIVCDEDPC